MILLQKSLKLAIIAFFDHMLACFGTLVEFLIDQGIEFGWAFKVLCIKTLINYWITSRNHLQVDGLAKGVV